MSWLVLLVLGAAVGVLGPIGVIGPLSLAYGCVALVRPAAGLAWTLFFLPLSVPQFQVAGIDIQPFELLVWPVCFIALASSIARKNGLTRAQLHGLVPLVVLCGYFIVASLLLWGDRALLEVRMWSGALLFALAFAANSEEPDFQRHVPRALAASAVVLCTLAIVQHYFGGPAFSGYQEPRDLFQLLVLGNREPVRLANLTFAHFNSAGAYMTLVVGALFGLFLAAPKGLGLRVAMVVGLVTLYLTYSRGAALAVFAGVGFTWALVLPVRWRLVFVTVVIIGVTLAAISIAPQVVQSDYGATVALASRSLIWQAYGQAWLSSPIVGLGPGSGFAAAGFLSPFGDQYAAHSNYLYIAADYGLLGIIAAVYGFGMVIVRTLKVPATERRLHPYLLGGLAAAIALVVHSLVDHTLIIFSYRVGIVGLLALSLRRASPELRA